MEYIICINVLGLGMHYTYIIIIVICILLYARWQIIQTNNCYCCAHYNDGWLLQFRCSPSHPLHLIVPLESWAFSVMCVQLEKHEACNLATVYSPKLTLKRPQLNDTPDESVNSWWRLFYNTRSTTTPWSSDSITRGEVSTAGTAHW